MKMHNSKWQSALSLFSIGALAGALIHAAMKWMPIKPIEAKIVFAVVLSCLLLLGIPWKFLLTCLRRKTSNVSSKTSLICAIISLLLGLGVAKHLPLAMLLPARNVTLSIKSLPKSKKANSSYYLIRIEDSLGNTIANARDLAETATTLKGGKLLNNGHGIWAQLSEKADDFHLEWTSTNAYRTARSQLYLVAGSSPKGSLLSLNANGTQSVIDLSHGKPGQEQQLPIKTVTRVLLIPKLIIAAMLSLILWVLCISFIASETNLAQRSCAFPAIDPNAAKVDKLICLGIIFSVLIGNAVVPFVDMLLFDDPLPYALASTGYKEFARGMFWGRKAWFLSPIRNLLYGYGSVYLGVPATRSIFILILSLASVVMYFFYRRVLCCRHEWAFSAATIPNILPSLISIPASLNSTYAPFALIPFMVSMLLLWPAFYKPYRISWLYLVTSFLTYIVAMETTSVSGFLVPCALFICFVHLPRRPHRALAYAIPFLLYGMHQNSQSLKYGHRTPVQIPWTEMLSRFHEFLQMACPLPIANNIIWKLSLAGSLLGIITIFILRERLFTLKDERNGGGYIWTLLAMLGWPLCWFLANAGPYIFLSPTRRTFDYAYISNYGIVFLHTSFIVGMFVLISHIFKNRRVRQYLIWSASIGVTCYWGVKRIETVYKSLDAPAPHAIKQLRNGLINQDFPKNAQVIIADFPNVFAPPYTGDLKMSTGYLRYTLNRRDITGLIGPNRYPNDPFAHSIPWLTPMMGLDSNKATFVYVWENNLPKRAQMMLRMNKDSSEVNHAPEWFLYDLRGSNGTLRILASGVGLDSYHDFIDNSLPHDLRDESIVFAPTEMDARVVNDKQFQEYLKRPNLLNSPISFSMGLDLIHLTKVKSSDNQSYIEMLISAVKYTEQGKPMPRLVLNGRKAHTLYIWDFIQPGDKIIVKAPIDDNLKSISIKWLNVRPWPILPLRITTEEFAGAVSITVDLN